MPKVEMQTVVSGGRICFRGDDREPSVIFKNGFSSWQPAAKITYNRPNLAPMYIQKEHEKYYEQRGFTITAGKTLASAGATPAETYRHAVQEGPSPIGQPIALVPRTPDVDLRTAVCVTPRFSMAILFPPKEKPGDIKRFTWVYAVYVTELFNTHAQQVCDGLQSIKNEMAVRADIARTAGQSAPYGGTAVLDVYVEDVALWTLYAQELSTKRIEADHVIGAIKVDRAWKGANFTYGCDYRLLKKTRILNKGCKVDKLSIKAVKKFISDEPDHGTTPSRSSGFHKDDENTRSSVSLKTFIASLGETIKKYQEAAVDDSDDSEWL